MTSVVDPHALVWFLEASPRVGASASKALSDPSSQLVIPTIVLAEITFLYARKRITTDVTEIRRRLLAASNVVVYPLDEQFLTYMPTTLEIHDAIIVATALVYRDLLRADVVVITKDAAITNSGLVDVLW